MDAATPLGAWASIRGYFTPATLFIVLNLVIGTIALTSRTHQRRRREHHHQGQHYQEPPPLDPDQHEYRYYQQQQQQPYQYATPPAPAPIARTSSVLDRLRSIGLYRFRSGDFPPEYGAGSAAGGNHHDAVAPVEEETTSQYARSRSEPASAWEEKAAPTPRMKTSGGTEVVRHSQAVPAPATRAVAEDEPAEFIGRSRRQDPSSPQQKAEYHHYHEEEAYVPPPAPMRAPPPLSRTSSVLDRLRSLGLYGFLGTERPGAAATPLETGDLAAAAADEKKQERAHYDRSRSEPAREQGKKETKKQAAMAKSSSATRKAAAASSLAEEEDCVDARAEAFIDSFRKEQSTQKQKQVHYDENEQHVVVPPPPAPLARTSSVLDRLRSFSLYLRSSDPGPEDADEKKQARYARSRSEPTREQEKKKTEDAAEECVNARADDFINKFRQQLQLQRLNSLLNYSGGSQQ